ncbi:nitroreductase family protein [Candidatus Sumerlaeota bacterium]|nr:nitroreductase family protein [Candidatus Sumerlaeota bacterium]
MNVSEAIRRRRSVRAYQNKEIEPEKLERVLEAARLAPSARNMQDWKFIVVRDPETRRRLDEASNGRGWIGEAPVVIACCGTPIDYAMKCGHLTYLIDVTIAIDHMTLQAVEEGLGTCWIGAFNEPQVREILGVPDTARVVELLPIGYPAEDAPPERKPRKALNEIVCYERWE